MDSLATLNFRLDALRGNLATLLEQRAAHAREMAESFALIDTRRAARDPMRYTTLEIKWRTTFRRDANRFDAEQKRVEAMIAGVKDEIDAANGEIE